MKGYDGKAYSGHITHKNTDWHAYTQYVFNYEAFTPYSIIDGYNGILYDPRGDWNLPLLDAA